MEHANAKALMEHLMAAGDDLNAAAQAIESMGDEEERHSFRRNLGEVMSDIYIKLMLPVIQKHPDLDPDRK